MEVTTLAATASTRLKYHPPAIENATTLTYRQNIILNTVEAANMNEDRQHKVKVQDWKKIINKTKNKNKNCIFLCKYNLV